MSSEPRMRAKPWIGCLCPCAHSSLWGRTPDAVEAGIGLVTEADPPHVRCPSMGEPLSCMAEQGLRTLYPGPLANKVTQVLQWKGALVAEEDLLFHEAAKFHPESESFDEIFVPGEKSGGPLVRLLVKDTAVCRLSRGPQDIAGRLHIKQGVWREIRPYQQTHPPLGPQNHHTTHLCVSDARKNFVSVTLTHGP